MISSCFKPCFKWKKFIFFAWRYGKSLGCAEPKRTLRPEQQLGKEERRRWPGHKETSLLQGYFIVCPRFLWSQHFRPFCWHVCLHKPGIFLLWSIFELSLEYFIVINLIVLDNKITLIPSFQITQIDIFTIIV